LIARTRGEDGSIIAGELDRSGHDRFVVDRRRQRTDDLSLESRGVNAARRGNKLQEIDTSRAGRANVSRNYRRSR
jgi:hypothetical protein